MKHELNRVWEEADVTKFKALSHNLPEGTEENHEKPQQGKPMPISQLRFNQPPLPNTSQNCYCFSQLAGVYII